MLGEHFCSLSIFRYLIVCPDGKIVRLSGSARVFIFVMNVFEKWYGSLEIMGSGALCVLRGTWVCKRHENMLRWFFYN